MKTHLSAFLVTVGIFAAVILIAFAIVTWRWVAFGILCAIVFVYLYCIFYRIIRDAEHKRQIDEKNEPSGRSTMTIPSTEQPP